MTSYQQVEASIWRNGFNFALLILFVLGLTLVVMGAMLFPAGTVANLILVGMGIAMAPGAVVSALFRVFLFQEVRYELTYPVVKEVKERLGPEIREQVMKLIEDYRTEIETLRALRDAGVICPHRDREQALKDFTSAIDTEESEIMIIGSSLKGLLQREEYREIANKLDFKIHSGGVRVKFLLTHPVVADLRAGQEARQPGEIGREIIDSLLMLKQWNVKAENVRLYKGTPTCFAIRTKERMLLNPYPYAATSMDSPCLIVETTEQHPGYFYDAFKKSHFGAWDTNAVTRIYDYDQIIDELQHKLTAYSEMVSKMLEA
jgi:hypothetical protein